MKRLPTVIIVGRPNVGKSTLFNRLTKKRKAIVDETPGVTRDVLCGEVEWRGKVFELLDSGGLDFYTQNGLTKKVREEVLQFLNSSDLAIFMVDAKEGLNPLDEEIAQIIRKSKIPYILVANKMDTSQAKDNLFEFYKMGMGEPIPISSLHSLNLGVLLDKIWEEIPEVKYGKTPKRIKISFIGVPNTGKSTLTNTILGEERVLVDDRPGTTRDTVEIPFSWKGKNFLLLDTAGIRRRSRVKEDLDWVSVKRAEWGIENADVVCFLLDLSRPVIREDLSLARKIEQKAKNLMVLLNKADLIPEEKREEYLEIYRRRFFFLGFAPFLFISGKTGENVEEIFEKALDIYQRANQGISSTKLREILDSAMKTRPPRHDIKIYSLEVCNNYPKIFCLKTNNPKGIRQEFLKFIKKKLWENFSLEGINIKIKTVRK